MVRNSFLRASAAFVVCAGFAVQPALADVVMVPTGTSAPRMSQVPAPTDDSPEEIAQDAARDLKDSRFYNKPGATRAQYNADWQRCRLIARGSQTPGGSIPYYYNPAVVSPLAAGIGAGIGGMLGAAIVQGQQRRANRRQCLMINGWRQIEVPAETATRIAAMSDDERDTFFNSIVGADEVDGEITERTSFAQAPGLAERFDGKVSAADPVKVLPRVKQAQAQFASLGADAASDDEAVIVFAFRRASEPATGRSGALRLFRYDADASDLSYQPRDWKKTGDFSTYTLNVQGKQKTLAYETVAVRVTPGSYVYDSFSVGPALPVTSNCFGAPMITVKAGEVVYAGDFLPVINGRDAADKSVTGLFWASHIEDARQALSKAHPAWAERLQPGDWRNGATYACAGAVMDRYDLPGFPERAATVQAIKQEDAPVADVAPA